MLHVKQVTTKQLSNKISIAERILIVLFLVEDHFYEKMILSMQTYPITKWQNVSSVTTMYALLVLCIGSRLIYQSGSNGDYLRLRFKGLFTLLYIPHLLFSFFFGIWIPAGSPDFVIGPFLFLLKLAAIVYFNLQLYKVHVLEKSTEQTNALEKNQDTNKSDILCLAGLCIVWIIDLYFVTPHSSIDTGVFLLEFVLFILILFGPHTKY